MSARLEEALRDLACRQPVCSCFLCVGRVFSEALAHLQGGGGPFAAAIFDSPLADGDRRMGVIYVDAEVLRRIVLPAVAEWMDKVEARAAAAEAEGEALAARMRQEGGS